MRFVELFSNLLHILYFSTRIVPSLLLYTYCTFSTSLHVFNVELQILVDIPDQPEKPMLSEVDSRALRVAWKAPFDGNAPLVGCVVEARVSGRRWGAGAVSYSLPPNATSFRIDSLHPAYTYDIRVLASNAFGNSTPSEFVTVTLLPERMHIYYFEILQFCTFPILHLSNFAILATLHSDIICILIQQILAF